MRANLKERPQSRRIRIQSASNNNKRINKDIAQDNFKKGKGQQAKDHFEKAIQYYTRAVGYNPNYFQAYCNMGYCYRALGKYSEAKRCYLSSLSINKQDHISHYNLANLYRIMGQNQFAIEQYSCIISLAQSNISVGNLYINSLINMGICYKNQAQLEEAIAVYRKVLEIDPNQQDAQFNLAICLLNSIQSKNFSSFNKFYKQRALEADQLFKKIFQINEKNYMAKLCLLKISVFLDNNKKNIEQVLTRLKEMLQIGECGVKNQVREQIAWVLSFLQQFQQSSKYYQHSMERKVSQRGKKVVEQNKKIDNLFGQFQQNHIITNYNEEQFFTEADGIFMIEEGKLIEAQLQIEKLSDTNMLKHSLQLMLYLKEAEDDEESQCIQLAIKLYKQSFQKPQNELPFTKLSLQTHKALGKILNLQGKYQKAIQHYEYISSKLKNDRKCASAKMFSELGEGFQVTGDYPRALEQYKRAIEIEPDNYGLTYNMAYCLYQSGHLKQAFDCFHNILQNIKKNNKLSASTRQLYQTDCMLMMALSNQDQQKCFKLYSQAFQQFQKLKQQEGNNLQPLQDNLLMFLIEASQHFQDNLNQINSTDHQFQHVANILLQIYSALLDLEDCPDTNQILINSGNIYYQLHRYAAATHSYEQVRNIHLVPQINLALAYAHLIQPMLANKYMKSSCKQFAEDQTINFCNQILQWIYFNERTGQWNRCLPFINWDMFYERNQYGLALIDKLTESINKTQLTAQQLKDLFQKLVNNGSEIKFKQQGSNVKFQKIKSLIQKYDLQGKTINKNVLNSSILKLCFTKSNNLSEDFLKLVDLLCNIAHCGRQGEFCELAIHLFIYNNKLQSSKMRQCLLQFIKREKQSFIINIPDSDQRNYSIYTDFKNIKQFILTLKEWEAVLDSKIAAYLQIIEEVYYSGKIRKPLEFQYHFPRHHNLLQKDENFQKVIYIVLSIIKYDNPISCKGSNVGQMRQDLIKQFQQRFNLYLEKANPQPITLSSTFVPLTIYTSHESKEDCHAFVNEVSQRMNGQALQAIVGDYVQVVIDKLVRMRCRWSDPYSLKQVVKEGVDNIIDNPMFIINQSIIYLQKMRKVIKIDSQQARKYISLDSSLNY